MENILLHIERLLASNDHVIVPGLGVFAVQKNSAVIRGNYILPPRATIGFNPMVHHNDGLLALEISRTHNVTYREATRTIDSAITLFLEEVNSEDAVDFGNLGSFLLNDDGRMLFTPAGHIPFLPVNLGQRPIRLPAPEKVSNHMLDIRFPAYRIMRYAAAVVFVVALLYSSRVNHNAIIHDQANLNMFQSINWEQLYPAAPVYNYTDSSMLANAILPYPPEEYSANDTTISSEEEVLDDLLQVQTAPYSIVAGVFQTEASALRLANNYSPEFLETTVVAEGSYYMVTISNFDDIQAAIQYMEYLRKEDPRFTDVWVIKN